MPFARWAPSLRPLILLVCLLTCPKLAGAQTAEEARVLFDAGVGASGAGRWSEARSYLKRSAALYPKAATLLNLALAEVKLGLRSAALQSLGEFDRLADPAIHADLIGRAQSLRAVAEALPTDAEPEGQTSDSPSTSSAQGAVAPPKDVPPTSTDSEVVPPDVASGHPQTPDLQQAPLQLDAAPLAAPIAEHRTPGASLRASRALLASGVSLVVISTGFALWWRWSSNGIAECTERVPRCDNLEQLKRQRWGPISITLATGAAGLALSAIGATWLVKQRSLTPVIDASRGIRTIGLLGQF